jgi:uncharacterized membrane protein (UPF0136 family)
MIVDDPIAQPLSRHLRILAICWVLYGIIRLVIAVWLALFSSTATLMFGALLNRVPDPFSMMNIFHFLYGLLVAISAVCGIFGVLAGLSLLAGTRSGRTLAIVAAFLSLSNIPLGTTLGIYSLIVLLIWSPQHTSATVPGVQIPNLKHQPTTL